MKKFIMKKVSIQDYRSTEGAGLAGNKALKGVVNRGGRKLLPLAWLALRFQQGREMGLCFYFLF